MKPDLFYCDTSLVVDVISSLIVSSRALLYSPYVWSLAECPNAKHGGTRKGEIDPSA
jgi:hypothetical protein